MGKMTKRYDMEKLKQFLQQPKTLEQIGEEFGMGYIQTLQMINVATYRLLIYEEVRNKKYIFGLMEAGA